MQETLVIRKADAGDAPEISRLISRVAHYFSSRPSGEVAPWFLATIIPDAIAGYISDSRFNYLAGFMGPALVGVVAVRDAAHVYHLFVAPEFHRHGIALRLWERAKADAIASGNTDGFTVRSSEYAVPFYERVGFRAVGARAEKNGVAYVPMALKPQAG